jgi:Domain of unknown function (DUF4386)
VPAGAVENLNPEIIRIVSFRRLLPWRFAFPPRHRLGTDLRGRVCLPALGSLPITRPSEQDARFADGDPGSAPDSHHVRECAERVRGADFLSVFDQPQRQALAMECLNLHGEGFVVAGIFWGLWLFPFGILLFKSGFLPRILGVLLIAAGFAYLADR